MPRKIALTLVALAVFTGAPLMAAEIIHDAERTILEEQFGEQWAAQDVEIQKKLDEMYAK